MAALEAEVVSVQQLTDLDDYQFLGDNATVQRKRAVVSAYREEGSIYHAALNSKVNRKTVYRWIDTDPEFAQALEESKEDCYDKAETSVFRKALAGDSLLLMFYLKAHRPKFRDKVTIDIEAVNEEIRERMRQLNSNPAQMLNPRQFPPSSSTLQKEDEVHPGPIPTPTTSD